MAWFSTQVKNMLKRTRGSTHPCLTPLEMLKGSDASPSESTCPVMSSWNWRIRFTNLVGHPSLDRITHTDTHTSSGLRRRQRGRCTSSALGAQRRSCQWCCIWTESTLGFQQVFRDVGDDAVEDDPSQDLPSDGQERDAPVVAVVSLNAPVLEQGHECGIPEFFGHILFFPDAGEE